MLAGAVVGRPHNGRTKDMVVICQLRLGPTDKMRHLSDVTATAGGRLIDEYPHSIFKLVDFLPLSLRSMAQ